MGRIPGLGLLIERIVLFIPLQESDDFEKEKECDRHEKNGNGHTNAHFLEFLRRDAFQCKTHAADDGHHHGSSEKDERFFATIWILLVQVLIEDHPVNPQGRRKSNHEADKRQESEIELQSGVDLFE